jgi:hypothetical protein
MKLAWEKAEMVRPWGGTADERTDAGSAIEQVADSPYCVQTVVKPFLHLSKDGGLGIVTANIVAQTTAGIIVKKGWQTLPLAEVAQRLRAVFDTPLRPATIEKMQAHDVDSSNTMEIILIEHSLGAEAEEPLETAAPAYILT